MGRTIRASFGTTKYCNSFLRNLPCNNPDCLYLHELGDEGDRFTKDEVQLGLARHGSSFAFKEEVLGDRAPHARRSANPVFPPPCAMPPANYQREGLKNQQHGSGGSNTVNSSNTCGGMPCGGAHAAVPPPSTSAPARGCQTCRNRGGGGGSGSSSGFACGVDARWSNFPMTSGSPLPLDGPSPGSDERSRPRRRRGQRGRRGAGSKVDAAAHGAGGYEPSGADAGCASGG
ncbi:unnamed protein product, partial [Scytosiphon promiscuus]